MPSDRLSCIFCGRKESFKGLRGLHVHFNTCPAYRAIWERKQNPHSLLGSPKRALSPLPPEKRKRGRFDEQGGRDDDRGEGPNHPQQSGQSTDDLESPQLVGLTLLCSKMFLIRYRTRTSPPKE